MLAAQLAVDLAVAVGHGGADPRRGQDRVRRRRCRASSAGSSSPALLAAAALLAIGLFVAAVAPTAARPAAIGAMLFYPMMFFAGLWLPIPVMPAVLQHISHATPLGAAVQALQNAPRGTGRTGCSW